ncbi:MAG: hypothetical protein PVI66_12875 [Candidatus Aminicenantes bacterium]|jgi:hypothetical protein
MRAVLREKITELLQELPHIVNTYASYGPYSASAIQWLESVEKTLLNFRSPLASQVAVERSRILAVKDGMVGKDVVSEKVSKNKAIRAVTTYTLIRVEESLRDQVEKIDQQLKELKEKMASYLAAVTAEVAIPLPPTEPRLEWLRKIWKLLGEHKNTQALYNYLNCSLTMNDRLDLFDDLLSNLLSE